jgi:hypothetical protein
MYGLYDLLTCQTQVADHGRDGFFDAPCDPYCSPGYWVSLAVRGRDRGLSVGDLRIPADRFGYAQAIGIEAALNQVDRYPFGRCRQGAHYSPLVVIADRDEVDRATADVSGCVRHLFREPELQPFVGNLCEVIGDLHDNVWSHAESTGISAAQRWNKPYSQGQAAYIEFALADCGRGFLGELRRSGVSRREGIIDDAGAIAWCIQRGHSSKIREDDGWTQRLPEDAMGNPMGAAAGHLPQGNHHLGLGLAKLTTLVRDYGGELWLASGSALLRIDGDGRDAYIQTAVPWKGVALACRFATDRVLRRARHRQWLPDALDQALLQLLEGPDHDH